ncbi:MAG: hypothetical protein JST00_25370 [Deltaproteobacteria bacterium]|nr:hypothetical protein [Deltaproteobacteria bacterium]
MRALRTSLVALAIAALATACIGTTGSEIVAFDAYAAGPEDARGAGYTFTTGRGYTVTLDRMRVRIGGVYLNRSLPVSGGQERECFLTGVYVGQVPGELVVDVLDGQPQKFPVRGTGTRDRARAGEVWLTGRRVDAEDDPSVILDVAGTARRGADVFPFDGRLTIGRNRRPAQTDPVRPGADPLCSQRIVTPIAIDLTPEDSGSLLVRVDPRGILTNVEFAELVPLAGSTPPSYPFVDASEGQPNVAIYAGMRAAAGVYGFRWLASSTP